MDSDKLVELKDEELVKATGGIYGPGDRRSGPCKYCGEVHSLVFDRIDRGWEGRSSIPCFIFKCEKCGNDSYYSIDDDHLLR